MDFTSLKKNIKQKQQKYIFVGGGVASGIGKGNTISSIAYLLITAGYNISLIKIDPYLNIDAGTMAPREHGEVFVLDDGGEVDLDLGNYERALDVSFTQNHSITSGKIFESILTKERKGEFQGKTVQFIPNVTDEIKNWIFSVGEIPVKDNQKPDIVLIEIGGTVGDLESAYFYESIRQAILEKGKNNIAFCLISYVPYFTSGEYKTKPTQNAVKSLLLTGIQADFLFLRSQDKLSEASYIKVAQSANMQREFVISLPDVKNKFEIPILLDNQDICELLQQKLELPIKKSNISQLKNYLHYTQTDFLKRKIIQICIVGKYVDFSDCYLSIIKAIEDAGIATAVQTKIILVNPEHLEQIFETLDQDLYKIAWDQIKQSHGIVIAGGYGLRGFEGKIDIAKYAREKDVPILGICFGFQAMVIEYSRNVLKLADAHSFEFASEVKSKNWVIKDMPDASLTILGGTMRKGSKKTIIVNKNCLAYSLYGKTEVYERYRHRFEVNGDYIKRLEKGGLTFTGVDETNKRMEILELKNKNFYFGVQFHPEFLSRHFKPSPCYVALMLAAQNQLQDNIKKGKGIINYKFEF